MAVKPLWITQQKNLKYVWIIRCLWLQQWWWCKMKTDNCRSWPRCALPVSFSTVWASRQRTMVFGENCLYIHNFNHEFPLKTFLWVCFIFQLEGWLSECFIFHWYKNNQVEKFESSLFFLICSYFFSVFSFICFKKISQDCFLSKTFGQLVQLRKWRRR